MSDDQKKEMTKKEQQGTKGGLQKQQQTFTGGTGSSKLLGTSDAGVKDEGDTASMVQRNPVE